MIRSNARRSARAVLLVACALAVAIPLSIEQGLRQQVGHDFHVFWQAGYNFATGQPLYHGYPPGARPLKYPPFAALVFQPLAVFPLQVAGALFSLLNLGLWVAAVYLTREIVARTFPARVPSILPLVLAVLFTAQFFLDNFHHAQMNEVIFVLVLLGVRAYLDERDLRAAAYLVAATAIKITPIFFVAWLVVRGRRRAALAVPALALACVLLPLLVRGPARGAAELVEYYHFFLEGHEDGDISQYTADQNLAAFVNRMTRQQADAGHASYIYLPTSGRTAQITYRVLWVAVMLIFLAKLVLLRIRRAPLSAFELSLVFLAGLLLSPITFMAHLVSLLFVYCTFLSVPWSRLSPRGRVVGVVLMVALAVTGLSGRDLAGNTVYEAVRGYSVFVWAMLLMFVAAVVLAGRESSGWVEAVVRRDARPGAGPHSTWTGRRNRALQCLDCTRSQCDLVRDPYPRNALHGEMAARILHARCPDRLPLEARRNAGPLRARARQRDRRVPAAWRPWGTGRAACVRLRGDPAEQSGLRRRPVTDRSVGRR